jgi:hydroxymethylbilane synthase
VAKHVRAKKTALCFPRLCGIVRLVSNARPLNLGTRGSQLALWQARTVAAAIEQRTGRAIDVTVIKTSGDRLAEAPLSEVGGKRLFVKELEDALLDRRIDLAVHSAKDMPAVFPGGLAIAAMLPREDPRDAIVLPAGEAALKVCATYDEFGPAILHALGAAPRLGTSSVRRVAQLTRLVPGARFVPIRGNLDTRLRKLDGREYDGLVLAVAGLRRLGFESRISAALPAEACVPAPGQGAVAVQIRADDRETGGVVRSIDDLPCRRAVEAERALVEALGGGCQAPIGALATPIDGNAYRMHAVVISLDGARAIRRSGQRAVRTSDDAAALGREVADALRADGAGAVLDDVRRAHARVEGLQP